MGYVKQEDVKPITAKEHILKNWSSYGLTDTKEDFIALINILQACGENLDSLHDAYFNGKIEFCDIFHGSCWDSDREIADVLFEFCTFYTEQGFIDRLLERREEYEDASEYVEDLREEATDDVSGNNDVQVTRTEDGYVRRIWC